MAAWSSRSQHLLVSNGIRLRVPRQLRSYVDQPVVEHPLSTAARPLKAAPQEGSTGILQTHKTTQLEVNDFEGYIMPAKYRDQLLKLESNLHGEQLLSAMYAPLRISRCSSYMPQHWAPCVKIPGVDTEYAEEVVYPPFLIRIPGFLNDDDKRRRLEMAQRRSWVTENEAAATADNYRLVPFHPYGQNFVIRNTRYHNNPYPDNWTPANTHCMGYNAEMAQFTTTQPQAGEASYDELFLDNGPQSFSFQHWLDHTPKVWIQGMHLLSNSTTILGSALSGKDGAVLTEFWHWLFDAAQLPFSKLQLRRVQNSAFAKRLLYSCRCPFIHPYHLQRWRELAVGPKAGDVPMAQRTVVLYFSRSRKDAKISNGGRRVMNEKKLLAGIKLLLQRRGKGEELSVFDASKFPTYKDLATYINTEVRAIVGPHGGALMNVQFATKNTLVVEFQPDARINEMVWENAVPLRANYWCLIYPSVWNGAAQPDMLVDVSAVMRLLDQELGKEYPLDHFLMPHSPWKKSLVEGQQQPKAVTAVV